MTRGAGFPTADVDVGLLDDPKLRHLVRTTRDEGLLSRLAIAYVSIILGSWREGERIPLEEAAPVWLTEIDDLAGRLVAAKLLDGSQQIPNHAWSSWFGAAAHRRDDRRFEGMVGGLMRSLGLSKPEAQAEARRRLALGGPDVDLGGPDVDLARTDTSDRTDTASPPNPPRRGGRRSDGMSPRQVAAQQRSFRKRAIEAVRSEYHRGEITEAERDRRIAEIE